MRYRLDLGADPAAELRRCAGEQLRHAIERLADPGDDRVGAVHDARKDIKRTRALLRLARPALPAAVRRQENRALRDAARALAAVRDADVLPQTVDALAAQLAGRIPAAALAEVRERVAEAGDAGARMAGAGGIDAAMTRAGAALEAVADRVAGWPLDRCDRAALVRGATRAYRRGRRARRAARDGGDEALHAWRRRAKDLWYHARLLHELWPEAQDAYAAEARRLSVLLGDDHDLAVLVARLETLPAGGWRIADAGEVAALAAVRRAALQADADRAGRRLYAESPSAFGRRLARWADAR